MPLGSHVSTELQAEDRTRFTEGNSAPGGETSGPHTNAHASQLDSAVAPLWLQRTSLVILVIFCIQIGIVVACLPWWPRIWDQNLFINSHPALAAILHNGAVRGIISGLGLLDIWIGISEAIHYRDHRP